MMKDVKMEPYWSDNHRTLYNTNTLIGLANLECESVQCVVTSPPYWGLRKYAGEQDVAWADGTTSAYGLEKNISDYINHTVEILSGIRRVLRKDGVVFWNIGDSYYNGDKKGWSEADSLRKTDPGLEWAAPNRMPQEGYKPKDLCLIPFRVALAAQDDGWWVRSVIIWSKPNPMPESVKDRPTESHEYILMLTKDKKYYWDAEAVKEPARDWGTRNRSNFRNGTDDPLLKHHGLTDCNSAKTGRNIRSVWNMSTHGYSGAHFATFPKELPEKCIRAATPEYGVCSACGSPWQRLIERKRVERQDLSQDDPNYRPARYSCKSSGDNSYSNGGAQAFAFTRTVGWIPTCFCDAPIAPAVVLDPFAGSGTTLEVAAQLGRRSIGLEISKEYCDLAVNRNRQLVLFGF